MANDVSKTPPSKRTVFFRRGFSTLLLWGIVAATFTSTIPWAYLGLITALIIISTLEYFKMLKAAETPCFPRFGILITILYCSATAYFFLKGETRIPSGIETFAIFLIAAGSFILQLRHPIRGKEPLLAVALTLLGFVYVAFLFNFTTKLCFGLPGDSAVPGALVVLWLLAVTKFTDMGAYITGSLIGKNKMIPHVSPGKTWEGFGGAIFFAQLAACGIYAIAPDQLSALHSWPHVIALGFLLAVLAVVGDLAESILKRSLGAKDSGNMLPGIGGGLDLIDSICFTAPALWFYIMWVIPNLS
ncbi:MAG: phosphatidate cytidylyltransferase [Akkermansiaceae bacterium]